MALAQSIGVARLTTLVPRIETTLNMSMTSQLARDYTGEPITAKTGTIPYESQASQRAKEHSERSSRVAFGADPMSINSSAGTRNYSIERFAASEDFEDTMDADNVFRQLKDRTSVRLSEQISYDQDKDLLLPILNGTGTEALGRNVTTYDATTTKFDNDATDVLGILESEAEIRGSSRMVLSTDAARVLREHAQFKAQFITGNAARLTIPGLVDALLSHIATLRSVQIGNRVYQSGGEFLPVNVQQKFTGIFYMDDGNNILRIPWQAVRNKIVPDGKKSIETYVVEEYFDLIAGDPFASVSFINALT